MRQWVMKSNNNSYSQLSRKRTPSVPALAVHLKESLVTDKQVRFGRDQPFMARRCPPYSGVRLERELTVFIEVIDHFGYIKILTWLRGLGE